MASDGNLRPARVMLRASAALLVALSLESCSEPAPPRYTTPIHYSLLEYFAAAEAQGPSALLPKGRFSGIDLLTQGCDSRIDYHFRMPERSKLSGHALVQSRSAGATAALVVRTLDTAGRSRSIVRRELGPGVADSSIAFSESIDTQWGDMMRLRIELSCSDPRAEIELRWLRVELDGTQPPPPPPSDVARAKYNVLLILLDSLRPDHLQPYGAQKVATPRILELAQGGIAFDRARSTASWTRAAAASLLTSYYSMNHGILSEKDKLPREIPYLPAILKLNGYHTILITNNGIISSSFGFGRGFSRVHHHFAIERKRGEKRDPKKRAEYVWRNYIEPSARRSEKRPFFVYLHERDPHSPYRPPAPYDKLYITDSSVTVRSDRIGLGILRRYPETVSPEMIENLRGRYSGEVSFMDGYVGFLLDRLEEYGLDRNTLVVFVSDHGEEFWEHQSVGHGHTVYDELLRIPIIMRLPGVLPAGLSLDVPIDLADVAPTILDLLGLKGRFRLQGQSVLPYLPRNLPRTATAEVSAPELAIREHFSVAQSNASKDESVPAAASVVYRDWKLIHQTDSEGDSGDRLFDLAVDPAETHDLASAHPVVVGTLNQMRRWMRRDFDLKRGQRKNQVDLESMSPELEENLRALGYID
jgi:arylsulfatase A-like enzyme